MNVTRMNSNRKRIVQRLVLVSAALAAVSCGSDDLPVRATFPYEVNCGGNSFCTRNLSRDINGTDGSGDLSLSCEITASGRLSFRVQGTEPGYGDFELRVTSASNAGPTQSCVRVTEATSANAGRNTYTGACSPNAPSTEAPCQINFTVDGDGATGTIHCVRLTTHSPDVWRNVVKLGSPNQPAEFVLENCDLP